MTVPKNSLWVYRAKLAKVTDGDTVKVSVDLGFRTFCTINLRIGGINCPEINSGDKASKMAGKRAKFFTEQWFDGLEEEWPLIVKTDKEKKSFDRYIGDVWKVGSEESLSEALLKSGNAFVVK